MATYPALHVQQPDLSGAYLRGQAVRGATLKNRVLEAKLGKENRIEALRRRILASGGTESPGPSPIETISPEEDPYGSDMVPQASSSIAPTRSTTETSDQKEAFREYAALDPEGAESMMKFLDSQNARELDETRRKNAFGAKLMIQLEEMPPQQRPLAYAQMKEFAQSRGMDVSQLPAQYDPRRLQVNLMRSVAVDKYAEMKQKNRLKKADMLKIMTPKGPVWQTADEGRGQPAEPSSSLVTLDMGNKIDKEILGLDVADIKAAQERVQSQEDLQPRLETIVRGLESGRVDTDVVQSALLPVRQFANALGWTDDPNLSQAENVFAAMKFMAPRMRVTGSGSTSDKEMKAFAQAAPEYGYTTNANILLARSMMQVQRYNKRRVELMKRYLRKNKSLDGFGDWADGEQGRIFPVAGSPQEYGDIAAGTVYYHAEAREFRVKGKK